MKKYFIIKIKPYGGYKIIYHGKGFMFSTQKEAENFIKNSYPRGNREDLTIAKIVKEWSLYKSGRLQKSW